MSSTDLAHEFVAYACEKLTQQLGQIVRCAGLLTEEEVWHRANEHTNSVGNLILHLTGNVRQWVVAGLGGAAFRRDRPAEFAQRGPLPIAEIVAHPGTRSARDHRGPAWARFGSAGCPAFDPGLRRKRAGGGVPCRGALLRARRSDRARDQSPERRGSEFVRRAGAQAVRGPDDPVNWEDCHSVGGDRWRAQKKWAGGRDVRGGTRTPTQSGPGFGAPH